MEITDPRAAYANGVEFQIDAALFILLLMAVRQLCDSHYHYAIGIVNNCMYLNRSNFEIAEVDISRDYFVEKEKELVKLNNFYIIFFVRNRKSKKYLEYCAMISIF